MATKVKFSDIHPTLKAEVAKLMARGPDNLKKLDKPKGKPTQFRDGFEWAQSLEKAVIELETWCEPNSDENPFTMEVP